MFVRLFKRVHPPIRPYSVSTPSNPTNIHTIKKLMQEIDSVHYAATKFNFALEEVKNATNLNCLGLLKQHGGMDEKILMREEPSEIVKHAKEIKKHFEKLKVSLDDMILARVVAKDDQAALHALFPHIIEIETYSRIDTSGNPGDHHRHQFSEYADESKELSVEAIITLGQAKIELDTIIQKIGHVVNLMQYHNYINQLRENIHELSHSFNVIRPIYHVNFDIENEFLDLSLDNHAQIQKVTTIIPNIKNALECILKNRPLKEEDHRLLLSLPTFSHDEIIINYSNIVKPEVPEVEATTSRMKPGSRE